MICYWYLYSYKKFILFVAFTYFANKYCKSNKYYGTIVRYKIIRYKKFMPPDKPLYQ